MCASCHVVDIDVEFTDLPALKAACERLGWKFKAHQKTYRYFGRWVDDSPLPRNLFDTQAEYDRVKEMSRTDRVAYMNGVLGKCDHAIQVPDCNYEIGLLQRGNRFIPIWDWYDPALANVMGQHGDPLVQAYAVERAIAEAQIQGQLFTEHHLPDRIQLRIEV